jgi:hypothetical protein
MFAVSSALLSASTPALNRALQFGHWNIPASLDCSPSFSGFLEGIGHVFTGTSTLVPHLGQLTSCSSSSFHHQRFGLKCVLQGTVLENQKKG